MRIKTYRPKKRMRLHGGDAVPVIVDVGSAFTSLGGILSFFISSFVLSIKTYFQTKGKVREVMSKHEKIVDLR